MKKILIILVFLIGLVSCKNGQNKLEITIGMNKKDIKGNALITKENFIDLKYIILLSIGNSNYIIELDNKDFVTNYNVYKEPLMKKRKLEKIYNSLDKVEFYDLISDFGFPNYEYSRFRKGENENSISITYFLEIAEEKGDVNRSISFEYKLDENNKPIIYSIDTYSIIAYY